nr:hypothetical protein [Pelagivirga sediminicola]
MAAPLSAQSLLPRYSRLSAPCDLFDPPDSYQGRITGIACGPCTQQAATFRLDASEFDRFSALHMEKSKRALALSLHASMGSFYPRTGSCPPLRRPPVSRMTTACAARTRCT